MGKTVSEDSVRRAFGRGCEQKWLDFLEAENLKAYRPLLQEAYVLDLDVTVVPLYGHQEGAEVSYNPAKPGRPSRNIHTAFIGALRLVVGTEVRRGKHTCPQARPSQALAVAQDIATGFAPGICPGRHRLWHGRLHVRPGTGRGRLPVQNEDDQKRPGFVQEAGSRGRPMAKGWAGLGRDGKHIAVGRMECQEAQHPVAPANQKAQGREGTAG